MVLIPLLKTPDQYFNGVQDQFAGLISLFQSNALLVSAVAAVVLVVSLVSEVFYRRTRQAEDAARQEAQQKANDERDARLQEQIDQIAQRIEAPALPPHVVAPEGLPLPGVRLVGRQQQLDELRDGLRRGETMEVFAVQGTPTIGKTALAAVAVRDLAQETNIFPGGAIWVSAQGLEGQTGLNALWSKIAGALDAEAIARQNDPEAKRRLLYYALHAPDRPRLLIAIDNIEPGLDTKALLDTLAGGKATLLLTARHVLEDGRMRHLELHELDEDKAEELFRLRLTQRQPDRAPDDPVTLRRVVQGLGGLPTAIELAASYAGFRKISLDDLEAEMKRDGLHKGPLEKLRAQFDRSWRNLTPAQQRLFAGLSLLAGASFPREVALAVAEASQDVEGAAENDLNTVITLALVETLTGGRLRLHPKLREYASEQLATLPAETQDKLGDAALAWWIAYAQAHPGYEGMDALEAEAEGLMGALAWAHAHQRYEGVLALGHSLSNAWDTRGRREQTRQLIAWAIAAAAASESGEEQLWAAHEQAVLLGKTGQVEASRAAYAQVLRLAQEQLNRNYERLARHGLAVRDGQTGAHRRGAHRLRGGIENRQRTRRFERHSVRDARTGGARR